MNLSLSSLVKAFVVAALSLASVSQSSRPAKAAEGPAGNVLKEVFLKGSIDGKKMFVVLGMEPGVEAIKSFGDDVFIDGEDLEDLEKAYQNLGDEIVSTDCKSGIVGAICDGVEATVENAPSVLTRPWKSLSKIPKAYKVDFENARSAYYHSKNQLAGSLKYSGWAVWANIHGAYYLVIEAPVEMAANIIATVGAVPAYLAAQGVSIAYRGVVAGLQTGAAIGREAIGAVGVAAIAAYATVSSTTATALTALYAGGVAVVKGGKAVFIGLPRKIFFPVSVKLVTRTEFENKEQEDQAEKALLVLNTECPLGVTRTENSLGHYRSKIKLFAKDENGEEYKLGVLKITIKQKKIEMTLDLTRKAMRGKSKEELKLQMAEVLARIAK